MFGLLPAHVGTFTNTLLPSAHYQAPEDGISIVERQHWNKGIQWTAARAQFLSQAKIVPGGAGSLCDAGQLWCPLLHRNIGDVMYMCSCGHTHLFFVGCCSLCSLFTVFAEAHLWRESAFVCHCVPCILIAVVALAHPPLLYFVQLWKQIPLSPPLLYCFPLPIRIVIY